MNKGISVKTGHRKFLAWEMLSSMLPSNDLKIEANSPPWTDKVARLFKIILAKKGAIKYSSYRWWIL